jgi:hypothetical protein
MTRVDIIQIWSLRCYHSIGIYHSRRLSRWLCTLLLFHWWIWLLLLLYWNMPLIWCFFFDKFIWCCTLSLLLKVLLLLLCLGCSWNYTTTGTWCSTTSHIWLTPFTAMIAHVCKVNNSLVRAMTTAYVICERVLNDVITHWTLASASRGWKISKVNWA